MSPITRRFGATVCVIGPSWVVTRLPSGAEIHAHPTADQAETARMLGYGDDLAALTRDHDVAHVWLSHALGLSASISLRQASGEPVDPVLAGMEEAAVLAITRLCQALGRWPWRDTP